MPKPFLNKLIVHGAIGFFCVLFGCIYGFITDDQIFLLMSLCIGVGTAIRIVSLLHTIKMHDYIPKAVGVPDIIIKMDWLLSLKTKLTKPLFAI